MRPVLPTLELQYRRSVNALPTVDEQMNELFQFSRVIAPYSAHLQRWFLTSDKNREEALRYEAFDASGPLAASVDVIRKEGRRVSDLRSISLWNGAQAKGDTAHILSRCNTLDRPDVFEFGLKLCPEVNDWRIGVEWIKAAVRIWPALFATFAPYWYSETRIFKDRPGVGWMLYLPTALTIQQVPEARALVPVMGEDSMNFPVQIGTIVVSLTEGPFDDTNPEHARVANAIEIRLVDQDLLPTYAEL